MPRHLLDAKTVEKAKPKSSPYRLADGDGLYLFVAVSGVKSWQYRYRHAGRQQTLTIGRLSPALPLAEARRRAQHARDKAMAGMHLTHEKRLNVAEKASDNTNTFERVAERWVKHEGRRNDWTDDYRAEVKASIANHLAALNNLPVSSISAKLASPMLRKVEDKAPDMAKKVRQRLRGILDFAVEDGQIAVNPIPVPRRRKRGGERRHLPAITTPYGVGEVLRAAGQAEVGRGVMRAHLLCVFTAQRISEIVGAKWDEFDLDVGVWTIPRERMKRKESERGPHLVPLPPRLCALLVVWKEADAPTGKFACPSRTGDPITREAVEKFYRRTLGLSGLHSPHSWRTVFSTWSNDAGMDADLIEAQLDHSIGTKVQAAYDRAKRLERRAEIMEIHEGALLAAMKASRAN